MDSLFRINKGLLGVEIGVESVDIVPFEDYNLLVSGFTALHTKMAGTSRDI